MAVMFDTLKAYTRLREAGFDEKQATALVELISEVLAVRTAGDRVAWPPRDPSGPEAPAGLRPGSDSAAGRPQPAGSPPRSDCAPA